MPEIMGSGVALLDFDNDGDLDVFLPQGDFQQPGKTRKDMQYPMPADWKPGSRLFRNEMVPQGQLRFTDVTDSSGIVTKFSAMGVAVGDFDNDGYLDLLATGLNQCALFRNLGNGKFEDVTKRVGIEDTLLSTSAVFFDYDRDGWLDLFITNYVRGTTLEAKKCRNPAAELDYCGPKAFEPSISQLFHNEGGKRFRDVTSSSGIGSAAGPGLGVLAADFNSDGWTDLYVANDGAASYLWLNQKNGTFREAGLEMGVSYSADGKAQAGMGVAVGDIDNDGVEELFKTNLATEGANIYKKDAAGGYVDAAAKMNAFKATVPFTGFGVGLSDFDNDGWLDGFVANGAVMVMESQRGKPYPFRQKNLMLPNRNGVFQAPETETGPFAEWMVSRGAAFGDIDNDGDVDLVVSNNNGPVKLYRNRLILPGRQNPHWLQVRLQTPDAGLRGYQSIVTVETPSGRKQIRRVDPAGSYLSSSEAIAHFGIGVEQSVAKLTVSWPDGTQTSFVPQIDQSVTIKK